MRRRPHRPLLTSPRAPQRGFSLDKWETAYRDIVIPLCTAEEERRKTREADKRRESVDSAVSEDLERDAALIVRDDSSLHI